MIRTIWALSTSPIMWLKQGEWRRELSLIAPTTNQLSYQILKPIPLHRARVTHVILVEEFNYDMMKWHIAWCGQTSRKNYYAQQAQNKKWKCTRDIVQNGESTTTPLYIEMMINHKKNRKKEQKYFYNDDRYMCEKYHFSMDGIQTTHSLDLACQASH